MIDGSPDNSILNLIFGYNGFGRLSGGGAGGVAGTSAAATGVFRLFNDMMGGQASWLLPAALIVLVGGLAWRWRAPRTDRLRAALLLWGSWLLVSGAVFSFGSGVIHTYYTVELAPAIAALVAIGWRGAVAAARAGGRASGHRPDGGGDGRLGRRAAAAHAVLGDVADPAGDRGRAGCDGRPGSARPVTPAAGSATAVAAVVACLAAPLAYTAETISTPHSGSVPSAGPTVSGGLGGLGGPAAPRRGSAAGGGGSAAGGGGSAAGGGGSAPGGGGSTAGGSGAHREVPAAR